MQGILIGLAQALIVLTPGAQAWEPPVQPQDLVRFPCVWVSSANLELAAAHVRWVEEQIRQHPWQAGDYLSWLEEARSLRKCCAALDKCHCAAQEDLPARLIWLRQVLGPRAYEAGRMPPAVPVWRFRRIE